MASVFFDPNLGGDGLIVTDNTDPNTGLGNGGHRLRFVPALYNIVGVAQFTLDQSTISVNKAQEASDSADAALASEQAAALSETNAAISESNAADSEDLAFQWAVKPVDVFVDGTTEFSAKHYATKASEIATNYYTKAESEARYVNVSGDTMTGGLTVGTGAGGGIRFEGGKHRITNNDGGGNFNFRIGNEYNNGDIATESGTAFHDVWSNDGTDGTRQFRVSNTSVNVGDNITWNVPLQYNRDFVLLRYQNTERLRTTSDGVDVNGDLIVSGDLTVNGTTTSVNSTVTTVSDPVITLGEGTSVDDNKDRGVEFKYYDGATSRVGFFGMDDSDKRFKFIPVASNSSEVFSGTVGDIEATNFYGNLIGTFNSLNSSQFLRSDVDDEFVATNLDIAQRIRHLGDTNTYMEFNAADSWRVFTGGVERLSVNNSETVLSNNPTVRITDNAITNVIINSTTSRAGLVLAHADTVQGALHTSSTGLRVGYGAGWASNISMHINNTNGFVGIKRTDPSQALDVNGNVRANIGLFTTEVQSDLFTAFGDPTSFVDLGYDPVAINAVGIGTNNSMALMFDVNNNSTTLNFTIGHNGQVGDASYEELIKIDGGDTFTYKGFDVFHAGNTGAGSGTDADLLDGLDSTDFQRLNFIDTQNKYLFRHRSSDNAVLYINQTGTGDIARFYKGTTAGDTSNSGRRVTMTNDAQVVVDSPLTIGGGVTPENGHFVARTGTSFLSIDPNEIYSTSEILMEAATGNITLTASNGDIRFNNDTVFNATNLNIAQRIRHIGDTDTLIEFPANNQWRVIVGNSQKLLIDTSAVRISNAVLDMNSNRITELADPINNQDAVNLQYLDSQPYMKFVGNTLSGDANNANYWAKIATVNTGGANSDASIVIGFTTTAQSSGAAAQVHFHVRSNPSSVADDLQVEIQAASGLNFTDNSFKITNTGGVVELWVKKTTSFTAVNFYQMSASIPGGWSVVYEQDSPWIQNEPVGDVANVTSDGLQYRGNKVYHSGNDGTGSGLDADLLDGLSSPQLVRSDVNDQIQGQIYFSNTGAPIITPRGVTGGYSVQADGGNTTDWGANIWAIGENWDGTGHGINYTRGNHYGLSWLRSTHPEEIPQVAEGLYVDVAGTMVAAFGTGGTYLSQELYLSGLTDRSLVTDVGAGFGTLRLNGIGLNGYSGVSLEGEGVFMSNGTVVGIYDDINNGWIMRADYGGASRLFFSGTEKLETQSGGILVSGQVTADDFNSTSDRSKKDNIETAKGLEVIEKLRGVEFDWKDSGDHSSGVIAQEVEEVIPHAVDNSGDHKTVNYNAMIAYLIEGMKEQQEMIDSLKEEIEILKNK